MPTAIIDVMNDDYKCMHWCQTRADIQIALFGLTQQRKSHYVYILHRPNGEPFYVGKGYGSRIFMHQVEATGTSRKSHKLNILRSIQKGGGTVAYSIHGAFEQHAEALIAERDLINRIGRYDLGRGPLANQTDGGEGTLNPSEESKERHRQTLSGEGADDPDRATANKFFARFCAVDSNPIKPLSQYARSVSTLHKNRTFIGRKPRNSGALVAMAVAQEVIIQNGAELSRRFSFDGIDMILENGCGRDMLVNGMIELLDTTPKHERLRITPAGADFVLNQEPKNKLISLGLAEE